MDYKYINTEYLDSVAAGDPEIIRDIVDLFKEQVVEIYSEMSTRFMAKDFKALGLLAHKAKSSVSIMGMNDLAIMLKTFELQAKENKETGLYESYIVRYKNDSEEAIKELDNLIKNL